MQSLYTPGVHIQHVLTESERVLQTGVPVFLGLIGEADRIAFNKTQPDEDDRFVAKPARQFSAVGIARKRGYVRLPERPSPTAEARVRDSASANRFYLRAVTADRLPERNGRNVRNVQASRGASGQPGAPVADAEELYKLSEKPQRFTVWPQFEATYGGLMPFGFLGHAVRGFFENGGRLCYVQIMTYEGDAVADALRAGLEILGDYDEYDLVCVPDLMWPHTRHDAQDAASDDTPRAAMQSVAAMQNTVIDHCESLGDRFALLDSWYPSTTDRVLDQRHELYSQAAALYYPWVRVADGPAQTASHVPPCGHVAGVIARTDRLRGVHKAPANEMLEGVLDLAVNLTDEQQGPLNQAGINCLRAFPRRGIRVWGARTLSSDPAWTFINVRRIFITAARWIERNMAHIVFEPHTPDLWARIVRDLTGYFTELLEQGALRGGSAQEAFYVKCDAETNPPEEREVGRVVTEIGLAPVAPAEFICIRIIHGPTGVRIVGPT